MISTFLLCILKWIQNFLRPDVLDAVQQLKPLAQKAGCTLTQFSLAWVLREPNVASAIVGASRPEQLEENAGASDLTIDPALFTSGGGRCRGAPGLTTYVQFGGTRADTILTTVRDYAKVRGSLGAQTAAPACGQAHASRLGDRRPYHQYG